MGFLGDYTQLLISQRKEDKKIKNGEEKNKNLPADVQARIKHLKELSDKGDSSAAYELGKMYIEGKCVGYNPALAEKYFKLSASKDYFFGAYALAVFYQGNWSYCHFDAYKSYIYYMKASKCKCNDRKYIEEVNHVLNNEIQIDRKEKDENGNPMVWFKQEIPIR